VNTGEHNEHSEHRWTQWTQMNTCEHRWTQVNTGEHMWTQWTQVNTVNTGEHRWTQWTQVNTVNTGEHMWTQVNTGEHRWTQWTQWTQVNTVNTGEHSEHRWPQVLMKDCICHRPYILIFWFMFILPLATIILKTVRSSCILSTMGMKCDILLRNSILICDKVCQWLATGWWFSPGTPGPPPLKLTATI
jgi:hypothetical protein